MLHWLSKRAHLHHQAKTGRAEHYRHTLSSGMGLDHEHLAALDKMHAEADEMPDLYLCPFGGGHTFEPEGAPNNTFVSIVASKMTLPGGIEVHHQEDNNMVYPLLLAICKEHGADDVAKAVQHDWHLHDHHGKPLSK